MLARNMLNSFSNRVAAHPDPTLYQHNLKEYRNKLVQYYGWRADEFERALDGYGSDDDSEID